MNQHEATIVVVDPDADRATALSLQLDRRGYHVFRRSSGIDALECVAECRPDLVLSDQLPDLERPELLQSIHQASPETRVLFVAQAAGQAEEEIASAVVRFLGE
jgi:two-component system response regulator GlrR